VYYLWRPNLPDEADNHLIELALAGGAEYLLTHNVRDFARPELRFPLLKIRTPSQFLREVREE
jgi:predicted nucleic acid-binding protein